MKLVINIDDQTAREAQTVYDTLGLDMETAVRMFLKRTVLEQRLPLETNVPVISPSAFPNASSAPVEEKKRTNNAITRAMAEDIWRRFDRYLNEGGDINAIAADAHTATGMNQGSAFIYLTILNNFVNGKHNTRNMKLADLKYYVERIQEELDRQSYLNTIESLKASIPYWDKEVFGMFASKVQTFIDELEKD